MERLEESREAEYWSEWLFAAVQHETFTNSLSFVDFVQLFPASHCIAIIDALYSFTSLTHFVVQWIFFKQFHPPSQFSKQPSENDQMCDRLPQTKTLHFNY